jgi:hypothetical protein
MKIVYEFERVARFSTPDGQVCPALVIRGGVEGCPSVCDVGAIIDPSEINPCLWLRAPLGLDGVREILRQFEDWREKA